MERESAESWSEGCGAAGSFDVQGSLDCVRLSAHFAQDDKLWAQEKPPLGAAFFMTNTLNP
jgi:hypothetical protein